MKSDRFYLDPRAGSGPLLKGLRGQRLPVKVRRLHFGDMAFLGAGPDGKLVPVGVEYKKLDDLLQCIVSKRLVTHQLPGMMKDYRFSYLLIEATVRPDKDSSIETFNLFKTRGRKVRELGAFEPTFSRISYSMMQKYLMTIENIGGVRVRFSSCRDDTLGFLAALYHWWQKPWDKHHSHLALPSYEDSHPRRVEVMFRRPSVLQRVAGCLPGIGRNRAVAVATRFRSVAAMVDAKEKDWQGIEGIGEKTAKAVHRALRGVREVE